MILKVAGVVGGVTVAGIVSVAAQGVHISTEMMYGIAVNFVLAVFFGAKVISDLRVLKRDVRELLDWKKEEEQEQQEEHKELKRRVERRGDLR